MKTISVVTGTAHRIRWAAFGLACVLAGCPYPAEARLGESLQSFKAKSLHAYRFKSETKKEDRSYEMFSMILDKQTTQGAPGFSSAITLTVVDGKIVGQSMIIRIGENVQGGKALATLHAMDFVYEALGKAAPKNKSATESEFSQYQMAIDQVLSGFPQHVKYPHYAAVITMSRTPDGDLLLAATPDLSIHPETKPAVPAAK